MKAWSTIGRIVIVNRFVHNAARSVGIGLLALMPALILPAVYARSLPANDLAAWLYAFAIATYVASFHLGVGPATSALVAREHDQPQARAEILLAATLMLMVATVLATLALLALQFHGAFDAPASRSISSERWQLILGLGIVGTAISLPLHGFAGYCAGIFEVGRVLPINLLQKLSLTSLGIVAALVWNDALATATAHLIGGLLTATMLAFQIAREIGPNLASALRALPNRIPRMLHLALPAALSGLAQLPLVGIHMIIVARHVPDAIVAFAVLAPMLTLVGGMIWSILGNMLPEMSADFGGRGRYAERQAAEQQADTLETSSATLALALLAIGTMIAAALPWVLQWTVTDRFTGNQLGGLGAYAVALSLRQLTLPLSLAFFATGRPWKGLGPTCLEAVTSVGLALLLTPNFGLAGLATAVFAGIAANVLLAPRLLISPAVRQNAFRQLPRVLWLAVIASILLALVCLSQPLALAGSIAFSSTVVIAGLILSASYWWLGLRVGLRRRLADYLAIAVQGARRDVAAQR